MVPREGHARSSAVPTALFDHIKRMEETQTIEPPSSLPSEKAPLEHGGGAAAFPAVLKDYCKFTIVAHRLPLPPILINDWFHWQDQSADRSRRFSFLSMDCEQQINDA